MKDDAPSELPEANAAAQFTLNLLIPRLEMFQFTPPPVRQIQADVATQLVTPGASIPTAAVTRG